MAGTPKYTPEFKQQAVELYKKSDAAYAEAARGLGVDPGSLSSRVKQADQRAESDPESQNPFQTAGDLRKLRRENERLKRENEILLKASAFFASKTL
ncbi:transposase [uncultured Slackia sp.]|uniref:transposase n=1 Tax=uncultured Slackia sp. TaxID=665903 RepID=UPI002621510D|nr:transposase [uncultured Slackia sp.]